MFLHVFVRPSFLFSLFCSVSVGKSCFSVKKFIWASKRRAEHPFAGQNTQQLISCYLYIYSIFFFKLNLFFAFFFSRECHCHIGAEIYLQRRFDQKPAFVVFPSLLIVGVIDRRFLCHCRVSVSLVIPNKQTRVFIIFFGALFLVFSNSSLFAMRGSPNS